jgi:hypothetical protein
MHQQPPSATRHLIHAASRQREQVVSQFDRGALSSRQGNGFGATAAVRMRIGLSSSCV